MTGFKETEIGTLPAEWEVKKIEDVADVKTGGNAPQGKEYFENGSYPFVRVQHFSGEKEYIDKWDLINKKAIDKYKPKLFPKDAIVFPKSGASIMLEKRAKLPLDMYAVSHLCVLISKNILNDFLFYYLKSVKLGVSSGGSTLPFLNISTIGKKLIPLPPFPEQHTIAHILSKIQSAIETQEKIIQTTSELKKALMQKLFTEGLNGEPQKETEIGLMPKSWDLYEFLKTVIKNKVNKKYQIDSSEIKTKGIYPVVDQGKEFIAGYYDDGNKVFNPESPVIIFGDHTRYFKYVDFPFILGADGTKVLSPNMQLFNPKFFYYYLASLSIPSRGYNRHFPLLKEKKIICPTLKEQLEIANILSTVDNKIEIYTNKKIVMEALFKSMLHHLMTGQIRVKGVRIKD